MERPIWILGAVALLTSCGAPAPPVPLTVAAAANLTGVFDEVGRAFQAQAGIPVVFSFGATAQLAEQIENGAPFDLFAAADTQHIDMLVSGGKLLPATRAVYALGQLALWAPGGIQDLAGLAGPRIRFVAIAQPSLAPYGQAAVEALQSARLLDAVQPKLVYAGTINQTRQMAESGNADAAFTAYSLVMREAGTVLKVDRALYRPINQAMAIVAGSAKIDAAKRFEQFLLGPQGRAILSKNGYLLP